MLTSMAMRLMMFLSALLLIFVCLRGGVGRGNRNGGMLTYMAMRLVILDNVLLLVLSCFREGGAVGRGDGGVC